MRTHPKLIASSLAFGFSIFAAQLSAIGEETRKPATVVDSIEALVAKSEQLLREGEVAPAPAIIEVAAIESPAVEAPIVEEPSIERVEPSRELPACEGGVRAAFRPSAIQPPGPKSGAYRAPDEETLAAMGASLRALADGDPNIAAEYASVSGYEVCSGREDESGIVLWRPAMSGIGAPIIAWRVEGARPLIVEAPHAFSDEGTLEEAVQLFESLGARGLIISGTHRCASADPSGCDGMTAVCDGVLTPYRDSDMAHNDHSAFELAHEVLSEKHEGDVVISIHGMVQAGVSLSDGTTLPTQPDSLIARLAAALGETLPGEPITVCNAWPGASTTEHLCGTTNVQGRFLNGVQENLCVRAAEVSSGRFLHLEQSRDVRQKSDRVIRALDRVITGRPVSEAPATR
jgi:hypothetical protein